MFNKRSLGQKKRRAKEDMADGCVGCLGYLFKLAFKIFFYPFTLIYYGFIKKDVNKNWKLFYKIFALIVWLFFTFVLIEASQSNEEISSSSEVETKEIKNISGSSKIETKKIKNISILEYSVLPLVKVGLKTQNRATQRIIISSDKLPTQESIKQTTIEHWKDNSFSKYDEFTIFVYLSEMKTNDTAYCVVEFDKKGKINEFTINDHSLLGTKWDTSDNK